MTREELVAFCRSLPEVYEDYPFGEGWMVFRHRGNRKGCAFLYKRAGCFCMNLKCEPMQADFWRSVYQGVTPGYHMNKTHWNTVTLNLDVPTGELRQMVLHSHSLTAPKMRRRPAGRGGKRAT